MSTGNATLHQDEVLYCESMNVDGTALSAAELQTLAGLTATTAELNRATDLSTRMVSSTATTLTVTLASHDAKVVLLASATTQTVVLPAASGTGAKYHFVVSVLSTDGNKVIKVANTLDAMYGVCASHSTATNEVSSFLTSAASDTITFDNTTTGGNVGTQGEIIHGAANKVLVKVGAGASG